MPQIKIKGDTKEIQKSLVDLSKSVKELGKSKVALFDKDQKDFLAKEAGDHLKKIRDEIEKNNKKIAAATKLQNVQGKGLKDQIRMRERITKLMQEQVSLQKKASALGGLTGGGVARGGGVAGGVGALGKIAGSLGPAGAALGAVGAFGAARGISAFNTFKGGVSDRIALRGRGFEDRDLRLKDPSRAARAGLSSIGMRRNQLEALDVFGGEGATQEAVTQRAEMERGMGIQAGTFQGMGGQLRGVMGGAGASKAVQQVQASMLANGITEEIGPYLETSANMLTELNKEGLSFSGDALAALGGLVAEGESAERAGRLISGVDQTVRNATGEQGAFFRDVFANAGIAEGNQTVGILDLARQMGGSFGADLEGEGAIPARSKKALKGLGIGDPTGQAIGKSMLERFNRFGDAAEIEKLLEGTPAEQRRGQRKEAGRIKGIQTGFGGISPQAAMRVETLYEKMAKGVLKKEGKAELEGIVSGTTELGNLKSINESNEGIWDQTKNMSETMQDTFGNQLVPIFTSLEKTMRKTDKAMSALLHEFGVKTLDNKIKDISTGKTALTPKTLEEITGGSPLERKELKEKLEKDKKGIKQGIEKFESEGGARKGGSFLGFDPREMVESTVAQDKLGQIEKSLKLLADAETGKVGGAKGKKGKDETLDVQKQVLDLLKIGNTDRKKSITESRNATGIPAMTPRTSGMK